MSLPPVEIGASGYHESLRFRENNFDLSGLNKLDSIDKPRLDYNSPLSPQLLHPTNAANMFYDKHPAIALDKIR